jgi:hypothetical protein
MKGHHPFLPYLSLFIISLSSFPYIGLGIGFSKLVKGCTLPYGKKGLKVKRVKVAGKS